MKVKVKTLYLDEFEVEVNEMDFVFTLKERISDVTQFHVMKQKLVYRGELLSEDRATLAECGIIEGDFVLVIDEKKMKKPPPRGHLRRGHNFAGYGGELDGMGGFINIGGGSGGMGAGSSRRPNLLTRDRVGNNNIMGVHGMMGDDLESPMMGLGQPGGRRRGFGRNTGTISDVVSAPTPPAPSPPANPTPTLSGDELEAAITDLSSMGFPRELVANALSAAGNSRERAIDMLLTGSVPAGGGGGGGGGGGDAGGGGGVDDAAAFGLDAFGGVGADFGGGAEGFITRRVVDADNSCLFTATAYLLEGARELGGEVREKVANTIETHPETYTEAMLGKPPAEYLAWIRDSDSWGGEIELSALATVYTTQFVVFNIVDKSCRRYGEDYMMMVMLIYDGVHYDALAMSPVPDGPEEIDLKMFTTDDAGAVARAQALVDRLHAEDKFTDTSTFSLICGVCRKGIEGTAGAEAHAAETGHQNFQENPNAAGSA